MTARGGVITTVVACALASPACITEPEGLLFVQIDDATEARYASPVSVDSASISGQVVRAPPRQFVITTVTIQGGAATVVDTTNNSGVFLSAVPLVPNTVNRLVFVARDDTGAESREVVLEVTHQDPP